MTALVTGAGTTTACGGQGTGHGVGHGVGQHCTGV
jgi:hypothetical protein